MKDLREILFNKMQPSKSGGVEIDTNGILEAMQEAAKDRAVMFMMRYQSQQTNSIPSLYEIERMYDIYNESEIF